MKRVIKASTTYERLPITELTDDEIQRLPNQITVVTRRPGASSYSPEFRVVNRDALENPDECIFIDSYWGYARGRDVYIATKGEVEEYFDKQIQRLQQNQRKFSGYAF